MGLKGTITLISEGWNLFYKNLGVIWKQAQFSFWMGIVSTFVVAGSLSAFAIAYFINSASNTGSSSPVVMMIINIICALVALAGVVATILFTVSYGNAVTKTLGQLQGNNPINTKDKYLLALPALGISVLTGLIVFGGFLLLIVPGIIFWIWFAFSMFARLIDNKKGLEALRYSRSLSRGRFWKVLGRILLINIIMGAIAMILFAVPRLVTIIPSFLVSDSESKTAVLLALIIGIPLSIVGTIIQVLFAIFIVAILVVFYFNLKETMGGPTVISTATTPEIPSDAAATTPPPLQ